MPLSPAWLALSVPGALAGGFGVFRVARSLIGATRSAIVATAPLTTASAPASVEIRTTGELALFLETPRFTSATPHVRGVRLAMATEDGDALRVRPTASTTRVSSFDRVRVEVARVHVARRTRYRLWAEDPADVAALGPEVAVVVSRPIGGRIVLHVLGLLLFGWLAIGGIVVTVLALTGAELVGSA